MIPYSRPSHYSRRRDSSSSRYYRCSSRDHQILDTLIRFFAGLIPRGRRKRCRDSDHRLRPAAQRDLGRRLGLLGRSDHRQPGPRRHPGDDRGYAGGMMPARRVSTTGPALRPVVRQSGQTPPRPHLPACRSGPLSARRQQSPLRIPPAVLGGPLRDRRHPDGVQPRSRRRPQRTRAQPQRNLGVKPRRTRSARPTTSSQSSTSAAPKPTARRITVRPG